MVKTAVCIRVKDEDQLLENFVIHYLNLGFDRIHIFDNNSKIEVSTLLKKYIELYENIITVEKDLTDCGQTRVYNLFLNENNFYDWILFIDADEFLYLHNDDNVSSFLNKFDDNTTSVIAINWLVFASSNLETFDNNKLVFEQFTLREPYSNFWNYFTKCFISPKHIKKITNFHYENSLNYLTKNSDNETLCNLSKMSYEIGLTQQMKLNDNTSAFLCHYMTLDKENMEKKRIRNKNLIQDNYKYTEEWYKHYFKNEIVDLRMNKYIENIKKKILR